MRIFGSVELQTESTFPFLYIIIYVTKKPVTSSCGLRFCLWSSEHTLVSIHLGRRYARRAMEYKAISEIMMSTASVIIWKD